MPGTILTDCKVYLGGYNLSGFHNSLAMEYGVEMLDDTVFGNAGTRSNKPGMKTFSFTGGGFWDGVMDKPLYDRIGAVREVMSFAELGNTVGDRVFSVRAVNGKYNPLSGEVGALLPFEMDAMSANSPLVRGVLLATGSKVATGQGTAVQLTPAVALGQRLYSALHVTAIGPTSIIVIVESDDNAGFTTPTTRLTHTTFTGGGTVGADWQELAGPVATDTYWRSKWTMVGAGPFTIFHTLGIL